MWDVQKIHARVGSSAAAAAHQECEEPFPWRPFFSMEPAARQLLAPRGSAATGTRSYDAGGDEVRANGKSGPRARRTSGLTRLPRLGRWWAPECEEARAQKVAHLARLRGSALGTGVGDGAGNALAVEQAVKSQGARPLGVTATRDRQRRLLSTRGALIARRHLPPPAAAILIWHLDTLLRLDEPEAFWHMMACERRRPAAQARRYTHLPHTRQARHAARPEPRHL